MTKFAGRGAIVGGGFIIAGATSIQWSSAVVTPALHAIGGLGASAWRFLLGSLVLLAITRPNLRHWTKAQWRASVLYGLAVALMNACFFQALARIPLGDTVTIEFLGPLLVAVMGRRTLRHAAFAIVAGIGVVFLGHPGGHLNSLGVVFALGAALGWGLYIITANNVGETSTGFGGLAVSMSIASIVTLPFAMVTLPHIVHDPYIGGRMLIVALMSIVLGFALEMQALRNVPPWLAGVMMAFDPAVAFVLGLVILRQHPTSWDLWGLILVIVAGVGVTVDTHRNEDLTVSASDPVSDSN